MKKRLRLFFALALPVLALAVNVNVQQPSATYTDKALVRRSGTGNLVQNGVLVETGDYDGTLTGPQNFTTTTAIGSAFTNQPSNDSVQIISSNAGDTTQTVTIIGTTTATNTVVVETIALNGTTPVTSVKVNWGLILAVKKSAVTLGTVTVRKTTGTATITAGLTAAVLSVGVNTVSGSNQPAWNRAVFALSDGATTKQIGLQGTDTTGAVIYDSKPLTGATPITSNSSFYTLTEIYTGDVEAARTETVQADGHWTTTTGDMTINGLTIGRGSGNQTQNTALGAGALAAPTQNGFFNTAVGNLAMNVNTGGGNNTAVGYAALRLHLTGNANIAIGRQAMENDTGGQNQVAIGNSALSSSLTGQDNVAIGVAALNASAGSDASNTAIGRSSLATLNGGSANTALGYLAGQTNVTGSSNVFIGARAGAYELGSNAFYVNDRDQGNTATEKLNSLIYGTFGANAAAQTITFNVPQIADSGGPVGQNFSAYLTGTVYTFTNTATAVTGGTTSPTVTLTSAGTYLIFGQVQMAYTGATVVAETAPLKLRRTNNTPADLTSSSLVIDLPVSTALTYTYGTVRLPQVIYTTTNTNDIVTIFANVSANLGAGTITAEAGGTFIQAVRLY